VDVTVKIGVGHFPTNSDYFNSFQAIVPLTGQEKGSFFTGVYLPQKSVLSPPIESQYKPFQKHVSSYQVKRSPGCFVWDAPTALTAGPHHI
jgi:hypothetical protein